MWPFKTTGNQKLICILYNLMKFLRDKTFDSSFIWVAVSSGSDEVAELFGRRDGSCGVAILEHGSLDKCPTVVTLNNRVF